VWIIAITKLRYQLIFVPSLTLMIIMAVIMMASKCVIAQTIETMKDIIHPKINNPQIKIGGHPKALRLNKSTGYDLVVLHDEASLIVEHRGFLIERLNNQDGYLALFSQNMFRTVKPLIGARLEEEHLSDIYSTKKRLKYIVTSFLLSILVDCGYLVYILIKPFM
jgi:hypothetical protein